MITFDEATKDLWEYHDTVSKALKALQKNRACQTFQSQLWEALSSTDSNLKWIQTIHIGSYYKVAHYSGESYYICRVEAFIPGNLTIECYVQMLTGTMTEISYKTPIQDFMSISLCELDKKEINLNREDLPLYINNTFVGTLLKDLLQKG